MYKIVYMYIHLFIISIDEGSWKITDPETSYIYWYFVSKINGFTANFPKIDYGPFLNAWREWLLCITRHTYVSDSPLPIKTCL